MVVFFALNRNAGECHEQPIQPDAVSGGAKLDHGSSVMVSLRAE